jgi:Protein of unknown function (DUF2946)
MHRFFRRHRQLIGLFAGVMVLFAALAPSLALAVATEAASPWSLMCSSGAWKITDFTQPPGPGSSEPDGVLHGSDHCPLCRQASDDAVALSPAVSIPAPRAGVAPRVVVAEFAIAFQAWFESPPSRGPPVS